MTENVEVKRIAFLVNGEVFYILHIPQIPDFAGVYEGMVSSPQIVDISNDGFMVEPGSRMIDGEFYVPVSKFKIDNSSEPDYEVE